MGYTLALVLPPGFGLGLCLYVSLAGPLLGRVTACSSGMLLVEAIVLLSSALAICLSWASLPPLGLAGTCRPISVLVL